MINSTNVSPAMKMVAAKQELRRINDLLKDRQLIVIGGLAVNQYIPARVSQDIDLVCNMETALDVLEKLYPSEDWTIVHQGSDLRPSYEITHRINDLTVYFGPKIEERGEYPGVKWTDMAKNTIPFRVEGTVELPNIRVPAVHALAYGKLISFLDRFALAGKEAKALADFKDFINLTNQESFSISEMTTLIRRNSMDQKVVEGLGQILRKNKDIAHQASKSSLALMATAWNNRHQPLRSEKQESLRKASIYLSAPHKLLDENKLVIDALRESGFHVFVPADEVERVFGTPSPIDEDARVRDICIEGIERCDVMVVNVDRYGLDSAWEIGYADGRGKPVVGFNREINLKTIQRAVNRRPFLENFMHGWQGQGTFDSFATLLEAFPTSSLYICGPFDNPSLPQLREAATQRAERIIFPEEYVPEGPHDRFPAGTRDTAINQLNDSDVVVVLLPRYGMDTTWQIGYATARGKKIVGLLTTDDGIETSMFSLWEHWMHGWWEKDIFTGKAKLCGALEAYIARGIYRLSDSLSVNRPR